LSSPAPRRSACATIGVFDGVHLGHRTLIETVRRGATEVAGESVVVTFDPHPAAILAPARRPDLLTTTEEKVERFLAFGIDRVVVMTFDRALASLAPDEFLDGPLAAELSLARLVVGHDFALGRDRIGTTTRLAELGVSRGFSVERLEAIRDTGEVVSSTRIREALRGGDVARVTALLGRPWSFRGPVVSGDGRGRTLGVPTANIDPPEGKLMPPHGVYAVRARLRGAPGTAPSGSPRNGVMNFGVRPTFQGALPRAEVHLLDGPADLLGGRLEVAVLGRIREERRFEGAEALREQIGRDIESAMQVLATQPVEWW
jgi:riboflavin kinase/FMN adenylyltransferase